MTVSSPIKMPERLCIKYIPFYENENSDYTPTEDEERRIPVHCKSEHWGTMILPYWLYYNIGESWVKDYPDEETRIYLSEYIIRILDERTSK